MSRFGSQYQIARPTGVCASLGTPLEPGTPCIATICERTDDESFDRFDYSIEAWDNGDRPDHLFSFWRTVVPEPNEQRSLLVDDEVLFDLFVRLADESAEQRVAFRFVLALILMRKRQLKFLGRESRPAPNNPAETRAETETDDESDTMPAMDEYWRFRTPGPAAEVTDDDIHEVLNPHLSDDDVRELTGQLSEILQGEL